MRNAQVAELVDALVSNTSELKLVPVRPRSWALTKKPFRNSERLFCFLSLNYFALLMTKLLKLFLLTCFTVFITPSFAQLSVGNKDKALTPQQLELVRHSDLYLVIPNSQAHLKSLYDSALSQVWTHGKIFIITDSDRAILNTKKNMCIAKIVSLASEEPVRRYTKEYGFTSSKTQKITFYTLHLNFRYYNDYKTHKDDFTFANMEILAKSTKEYFACKDNESFKSYINEKATLKNFTPNLIALTVKMINYNLKHEKVLNRETQKNIINSSELANLKTDTLYTTYELLVFHNPYSYSTSMRSETKTFKKYKYRYVLNDYETIDTLLKNNKIKYLIYPVRNNAWGEICLTVVNIETGEIIYSKKAKRRDFGDRIGKKELKKLSKAIDKS